MNETMGIELPLIAQCKILRTYHTIGDLRKAYPTLRFIKYIFKDPKDQKFKGRNPSDDLLLVANASITIKSDDEDAINKFTEEATIKIK